MSESIKTKLMDYVTDFNRFKTDKRSLTIFLKDLCEYKKNNYELFEIQLYKKSFTKHWKYIQDIIISHYITDVDIFDMQDENKDFLALMILHVLFEIDIVNYELFLEKFKNELIDDLKMISRISHVLCNNSIEEVFSYELKFKYGVLRTHLNVNSINEFKRIDDLAEYAFKNKSLNLNQKDKKMLLELICEKYCNIYTYDFEKVLIYSFLNKYNVLKIVF